VHVRCTCFKCDFLSSLQQISVKYHENKCKNVHHLHRHNAWRCIHFQQHSEPAHHWAIAAWYTQFHSARPHLWPPNSPNLNAVDYMVWGVMEQHIYQSRVNTVDKLKEHLIAVWSDSSEILLTLKLTIGESISKHVSDQMMDILNIFCDFFSCVFGSSGFLPLCQIFISAKWTEWTGEISCDAFFLPSFHPSVRTQYLDANISKTVWVRYLSRKWFEIETWLQWGTYRKWHARYRMVTWSMMSRDPEMSKLWPSYI